MLGGVWVFVFATRCTSQFVSTLADLSPVRPPSLPPKTHIAVTVEGSLLRHKQRSEVILQAVISRPVLSGGKSELTAVPFVSRSCTSGHAARMPLRNATAVLVGTRK